MPIPPYATFRCGREIWALEAGFAESIEIYY
jgi:hypothetical protein